MKLFPRVLLPALLLGFTQIATAQSDDDVLSRIKRQQVSSSNVASVGYSRKLHALEIEFTRGVTYRYLDVPRSVYRELMEANSKGHFISVQIRGKYRYVHVRSARAPVRHERELAADQLAH